MKERNYADSIKGFLNRVGYGATVVDKDSFYPLVDEEGGLPEKNYATMMELFDTLYSPRQLSALHARYQELRSAGAIPAGSATNLFLDHINTMTRFRDRLIDNAEVLHEHQEELSPEQLKVRLKIEKYGWDLLLGV